MTKHEQIFQEMLKTHEKEFTEFKRIHDLYRHDSKNWQYLLNKTGEPILAIIRKYESRVCGKMEGSGRGAYSGNVAEKFWDEIRAYLPAIDMIGIKKD